MKGLGRLFVFLSVVLLSVGVRDGVGSEPALPQGLGGDRETRAAEPALPRGIRINDEGRGDNLGEPTLPSGLGGTKDGSGGKAPSLPAGLGASGERDDRPEMGDGGVAETFGVDLNGFLEARGGLRTQSDAHEPDTALAEMRLQVEAEQMYKGLVFHGKIDFLFDTVAPTQAVGLELGQGWFDVRATSVLLRPAGFMDLQAGRQVLTWGVGDLVFINDLFPKDWNSFLLGRDVEYLKAPSDVLKVALYADWMNMDVVYAPVFDSDRYIDGRIVSYYNDRTMSSAGRNAIVNPEGRSRWFRDHEIALRAYRNINAYEIALYGYNGFWKSPNGFDPDSGRATFPRLSVYGASARGPILAGIGSSEIGLYDSRDDGGGDDPNVRNSEIRFLAGYEQELFKNFTAGVQYYLEYMLDHEDYERRLAPGYPARDEARHVLTLRLTRRLLNQNLELSFFGFYSPSDEDAYLRPSVQYKIDDRWSVSCGANCFFGRQRHTFYAQFEDNSNIWLAMRYGY